MRGINKLILLGNVGRNPETRLTKDGRHVTSFSLATNRTYVTKSGDRREETEWHRVVAFGRLAEICGQFLESGRQIYLEGRVQTRQWTDGDGNTRYTTEVLADTMQLLGRPKDSRSTPVPSAPIVHEAVAAPF